MAQRVCARVAGDNRGSCTDLRQFHKARFSRFYFLYISVPFLSFSFSFSSVFGKEGAAMEAGSVEGGLWADGLFGLLPGCVFATFMDHVVDDCSPSVSAWGVWSLGAG